MSEQFRELLKKVGSGQHTHKDLTRSEAATAMRMMLLQEATPAQIGAFMIAHRIKRPTAVELAGMLDACDELGPKIQPLPDSSKQVVILGIPYDGRTRTAPLGPITALLLAVAGIPTIAHGGDRMPTKYGIPLAEIWKGLGIDFSALSIERVQKILEQTGFCFVYTPKHFPESDALVTYRDQIGKRPPLATLELIWSPYRGDAHIIAGYVHPPTESTIRETLKLREQTTYTLVKGLEGSCDFRLSQTTIVAASNPQAKNGFEYLKISPSESGFRSKEVALESPEKLHHQIEQAVRGNSSELMSEAIWNGGFYLWRCGACANMSEGIRKAEELLVSGRVSEKREEVKEAIAQSK